jgi:nitroimidazol reductase NimA-like FMN-containing flavoprotein (pyridoxamine 5'-phosphate oxidase superfamily)
VNGLEHPSIQGFLATKEIVLLATLKADGAPLAMPMWFLHDASALTMISEAATHKIHNLRRDPRVCVVAEGGGGGTPLHGVTVQGLAEFLADGPERRALVERFHAKYPGLEAFWGGRAMPPDRVMFHVIPASARSWGL